MIGYVTVGTNDLERAAKFYDAIAAEMGTARMMEFDSFIAWGSAGGAAGIVAHYTINILDSSWLRAAATVPSHQ